MQTLNFLKWYFTPMMEGYFSILERLTFYRVDLPIKEGEDRLQHRRLENRTANRQNLLAGVAVLLFCDLIIEYTIHWSIVSTILALATLSPVGLNLLSIRICPS
jgi:hypothetical protein